MKLSATVRLPALLLIIGSLFASQSLAGEVRVAVASNFSMAMDALIADFSRRSQTKILLSKGSTGKFYAQIVNGAPFDIFLAADQRSPRLLLEAGLAAERYSYATGQLVLWSREEGIDLDASSLENLRGKLAIANPATAPYGRAAMQVLGNLKLKPNLDLNKEEIGKHGAAIKLVRGESVSQAYQFAYSGGAQFGLLAMSHLVVDGQTVRGSHWAVPPRLHEPIVQDAVLLKNAKHERHVEEFWLYLKSSAAQNIIRKFSYRIPNGAR